MSSFTVIGDPHATNRNLTKINQLFDEAESRGLPVIWLGDFLDTKEVIRGKCLNLLFKRISMSKLEHIILIGNHDYFNLECEQHSLEVFEGLDNVLIVDEPKEIFPNVHAIPYIHDTEELKKVLKKLPKDSILFGHLEVKGFDYGNGHLCESGITAQALKKFKRVISGHFHKFQEKGNLIYLGTPFSHSFGESNQIKYLGTYHVENDSLELSQTGFGRHVTLEYNADTRVMTPDNFQVIEADSLRVILTGAQVNIDKVDRSFWPENTKFLERSTDTFNVDVVIDETQSNTAKFQNWAKDIKGLDEETIKLGTEILEALK